ncbi:MAG: FkbM family methyltransferase [Pseudomonadota bacterium]
MQSGIFEQASAELTSHLIWSSDRFVNVGANAGYYCAIAQTKGIPTLAVEPNPTTVALLQRNMQLNGWDKDIAVLPVAVGDRSGFITLFGEGTGASVVPGWAGNPTVAGKTVPVVRLATVVPVPVKDEQMFILMDVEGFELAALKGAGTLINADPKPIWMVEISHTVHQPQGIQTNPHFADTLNLFHSAGYSVLATENGAADVSWDDLLSGAHQSAGDNYVFCEEQVKQRLLDRYGVK